MCQSKFRLKDPIPDMGDVARPAELVDFLVRIGYNAQVASMVEVRKPEPSA